MKILGLIAGAAMLLGAQSAYAVTIVNGGFDSPAAGNPFDALGTGNNASLPGCKDQGGITCRDRLFGREWIPARACGSAGRRLPA